MDLPELKKKNELEVGKKSHIRISAWHQFVSPDEWGETSVGLKKLIYWDKKSSKLVITTRVGTLIVTTIYLQLIQNRYMFRSFTVLQCSHQHCVQRVASDVEVVGYL